MLECTPWWNPTSKTLSQGSCVYECLALWHSLAFIAAHVLFISWHFINEGAVFSIITGAQFMVDMSREWVDFSSRNYVFYNLYPICSWLGITEFQDFFFLCVWSILASFFWVIVHSVERRGALRDRRLREARGHVVRSWAGHKPRMLCLQHQDVSNAANVWHRTFNPSIPLLFHHNTLLF